MAERVRFLEWEVTRRLDSLLHGRHEGLTPGHGTDLGESRLYVPGDEVRRIDWNVTARTNEVHVRDLIAERELTTWLVVDLDANMRFGTQRDRKIDLATAAIATIGFLNVRDSNKLGALLLAGPAQRLFPPRPGRDHVRAILQVAMRSPVVEGRGHTDLDAALQKVMALSHHRGMIALISDLRGGTSGSPPTGTGSSGGADLDTGVGRLPSHLARATDHHDVVVVQIRDRRDVDLPDVGLIELQDPATGRVREVIIDDRVRRAYRQRAEDFQAAIEDQALAAGADHLVLDTGSDWLTTIAEHVRRRRHMPVRRRRT